MRHKRDVYSAFKRLNQVINDVSNKTLKMLGGASAFKQIKLQVFRDTSDWKDEILSVIVK